MQLLVEERGFLSHISLKKQTNSLVDYVPVTGGKDLLVSEFPLQPALTIFRFEYLILGIMLLTLNTQHLMSVLADPTDEQTGL